MEESHQLKTIKSLQNKLKTHINILYNTRLCNLIKTELKNIKKISYKFDSKNNDWEIEYLHQTNKFNNNDYLNDSDDLLCYHNEFKKSIITFGSSNNKYFIHGSKIPFRLFMSKKNKLRIMNLNYRFELDPDEHDELMFNYRQNKCIPEWLAISVLWRFTKSWNSQHLIEYFTDGFNNL